LRDHRVGATAVVPAATWYERMAEVMADTRADPGPVALVDVEVPRATLVGAPADAVVTVDSGRTWVEVDGAPRARARAGAAPGQAPPDELGATSEDAARFYRPDLLFHGPTWRLLDRVGSNGDAAWATLRDTGATPWAAAVDAVHQLAALLLGPPNHQLGLPTRADAAWFGRAGPAARVRLIRTGPWTCDAAAYAGDGETTLVMRGVTLSPAAPWPVAVAPIAEEP